MTFKELLLKARGLNYCVPPVLLSFDPGETCGWALFVDGELENCGQANINTKEGLVLAQDIWGLIELYEPQQIVVEDYRVYASKTAMHTWNALYTPRLIGYIEAICQHHRIDYALQLASTKQFCSDEKLKEWKYYQIAQQHARDAIRHGCYYLLFNGRKSNA